MSAPFAVAVSGSPANRISDTGTGNSAARTACSNRSRNPGGIVLPPLKTIGIGRPNRGKLFDFVNTSFIDATRELIRSS